MSFRPFLRFLERFQTPLRARPAGPEDLGVLVEFAFTAGMDEGLPVTAQTASCLRTHFEHLLKAEAAAVFVVERDGRLVGMICCAQTPPEAWDGKPGAAAWGLYTVATERKRPDAALALLRAATEQALAWGAKRWRMSIPEESRRTLLRYERTGGFRRESTYHTYLAKAEA